MTLNAKDIFDEAWARPRDPRSDAYKAGCLAALEYRCHATLIHVPFDPGTAECDAFAAGLSEGHRLYSTAAAAMREAREAGGA